MTSRLTADRSTQEVDTYDFVLRKVNQQTGSIHVHPVGIEPTNSPIMSWAL